MRTTAGASADAPAATPAGDGAAADAGGTHAGAGGRRLRRHPRARSARDRGRHPAGQPSGTHGRWRVRRPSAATWKAVVTVVLLGLLATAVTLVLLQSAGVISWGFLGPTA